MLFELATPLKLAEKDSYTTGSVMLPDNYLSKFIEEAQKFEERRKASATLSEKKFSCAHPLEGDEKASVLISNDEQMILPLFPICEDNPINNDVPAWFGKGCRKLVRKRSKMKRRRKTN